MTRKHFIAMAAIFNKRLKQGEQQLFGESFSCVGLDMVNGIIEDFIAFAKTDNSNFNEKKFRKACGLIRRCMVCGKDLVEDKSGPITCTCQKRKSSFIDVEVPFSNNDTKEV
jgi:hypothetical protein